MGDHHRSAALVAVLAQGAKQRDGVGRIERRGWLVEEQELGPLAKRLGEQGASQLAPGELIEAALGEGEHVAALHGGAGRRQIGLTLEVEAAGGVGVAAHEHHLADAEGKGEAVLLRRVGEAARQRPGTMAAILGLADEEVEKLCRKIVGVWPANYNCPGQIVISGEHEAVEECCAEAESLGARRAVRLKVSGAFHSPLVARAADRLRPAIERVRIAEPLAPFMSTVTAKVEPAKEIANLLVDQLTAPVRFTQAATELIRSGATTFVEVGPGNVLSGLVKRIDRGVKTISVNTLESLERAQEALSR